MTNKDREIESLIRRVPTRAPFFLPTDKFPQNKVSEGLKNVKKCYANYKDFYIPKLRRLKYLYSNSDRCFIIGNGPSLGQTDLSHLKNEVTFAVNGFFLKMPEIDWTPDFYVVEDHLVAEDRATRINALDGPIKLFPAYLRYCLDDNERTIFFRHLPRKSYPHGFDFSTYAEFNTFMGGTVVFTCMQLAYYLGFKEIYLIGVDAQYSIPDDVQKQTSYTTDILDMESDDTNHFHPDYFGKGQRWHDPNVANMLAAYQEAKKVTRENRVKIFNATQGGALEVFERVEFDDLFHTINHIRKPHKTLKKDTIKSIGNMKILILDTTPIGHQSATGKIKETFFSEFSSERILQFALKIDDIFDTKNPHKFLSVSEAIKKALDFNADLILFRPTGDNYPFFSFCLTVIQTTGLPLITWIMDDWLKHISFKGDYSALRYEKLMGWVFERSDCCLAISDAMAQSYKKRYGREFLYLANAIDFEKWSPVVKVQGTKNKPFIIRYIGATTQNMNFDSILRFAEAVDGLDCNLNVRFEIWTQAFWADSLKTPLSHFSNVKLKVGFVSNEAYREALQTADCLLLAYNFDDLSTSYIGLSMANKLPEILASEIPLLVHGPKSVATVAYCDTLDCTTIVSVADVSLIQEAIMEHAKNQKFYAQRATKGRQIALEKHNLKVERKKFYKLLLDTATRPKTAQSIPRETQAFISEGGIIRKLAEQRDYHKVMIDVGAHHGSECVNFANTDWHVFAFEPENEAFNFLSRKFSCYENVVLHNFACGDEIATDVPFLASPESTGTSGFLPFMDTHKEQQKVNIKPLSTVLEDDAISNIGYLKIDTEGYDFKVLKGFPFNKFKPQAILVEYEDSKSKIIDVSWRNICDFLEKHGYTVYVSEWHPITRYGGGHSWLGLKKYPCTLQKTNSWGNLLAFLDDPGDEIFNLFNKSIRFPSTENLSAFLDEPDDKIFNLFTKSVSFLSIEYSLFTAVRRFYVWRAMQRINDLRRAVRLIYRRFTRFIMRILIRIPMRILIVIIMRVLEPYPSFYKVAQRIYRMTHSHE